MICSWSASSCCRGGFGRIGVCSAGMVHILVSDAAEYVFESVAFGCHPWCVKNLWTWM